MRSPAFQFYPSDFLTGTDEMSSDEVGLYIRMLSYQWLKPERGLPPEHDKIVRLCRWEHGELPAVVMRKFKLGEDGFIRNGRLDEERRKREAYQQQQSDLANRRWDRNGHSDATPAPIPETTKRHEKARPILHYLIEKSGTRFRETETNLGFIGERLAEDGVDADGVRKMIDRQVAKWKGTDMADYLRPETLFNKTKFDGYYAAREMPIETGPKKPSRQGLAPGFAPGVTP